MSDGKMKTVRRYVGKPKYFDVTHPAIVCMDSWVGDVYYMVDLGSGHLTGTELRRMRQEGDITEQEASFALHSRPYEVVADEHGYKVVR